VYETQVLVSLTFALTLFEAIVGAKRYA